MGITTPSLATLLFVASAFAFFVASADTETADIKTTEVETVEAQSETLPLVEEQTDGQARGGQAEEQVVAPLEEQLETPPPLPEQTPPPTSTEVTPEPTPTSTPEPTPEPPAEPLPSPVDEQKPQNAPPADPPTDPPADPPTPEPSVDEEDDFYQSLGVVLEVIDTENENDIVQHPNFILAEVERKADCTSVIGMLGTSKQMFRIRMRSSSGDFKVNITPEKQTSLWTSENGDQFDFNDKRDCKDAPKGDNDDYGGKMKISPRKGSIQKLGCTANCDPQNSVMLTKGATFSERVVDSITLISGSNVEANTTWLISGMQVKQALPAKLPEGTYSIPMVVTLLVEQ